LGALLQGIEINGRAYAGGYWDWITPFSVLTGVSLVIGYSLLGACWLIWKTSGPAHDDARRFAKPLTLALLAAIGAVSIYTPFLSDKYYEIWFTWPGIAALVLMPLVVAAIGVMLYRSIGKGHDMLPFALTLSLFGLSMLGLSISLWPDVIPSRLSIWDAAAPHSSQVFMLAGVCALMPLILGYTAWAYWVFRGKVADGEYH
jgi:cytochrome d ubiquinol oxidase subunit II